jgi:hypothetical protein
MDLHNTSFGESNSKNDNSSFDSSDELPPHISKQNLLNEVPDESIQEESETNSPLYKKSKTNGKKNKNFQTKYK